MRSAPEAPALPGTTTGQACCPKCGLPDLQASSRRSCVSGYESRQAVAAGIGAWTTPQCEYGTVGHPPGRPHQVGQHHDPLRRLSGHIAGPARRVHRRDVDSVQHRDRLRRDVRRQSADDGVPGVVADAVRNDKDEIAGRRQLLPQHGRRRLDAVPGGGRAATPIPSAEPYRLGQEPRDSGKTVPALQEADPVPADRAFQEPGRGHVTEPLRRAPVAPDQESRRAA